MNVARLDPNIGVRVLGSRELKYTDPARLGDDRPPHVRAASGLAFAQGRLAVVQDDAAFIAMVAGPEVSAIVLPRGAYGRRRFEVALGNKHEKMDLESCIALGDDLYAFGSGSTTARERVVHVGYQTRVLDASRLYRQMRDELGHAINIEGVASVRDDLWFFHRGNTGGDDRGPAIVRFPRQRLIDWLASDVGCPEPTSSSRYDLGEAPGGVKYGFTDAIGVGDRAFFIAAAEDSPNAVDDGPALGSMIGVIHGRDIRITPLLVEGQPLKAEGLTFDPNDPNRAWVVIDPDDTETPARLYELELTGAW